LLLSSSLTLFTAASSKNDHASFQIPPKDYNSTNWLQVHEESLLEFASSQVFITTSPTVEDDRSSETARFTTRDINEEIRSTFHFLGKQFQL
jgi:hypothetical protein